MNQGLLDSFGGAPPALFAYAYLKVSDQKANNTAGGSSAAADITQTRTLNTVEWNTIPGASLASNQVTLPPGSYTFKGRAPHYNGVQHKAFLYNVTDATYPGVGSSANSVSGGASGTTDSVFSGAMTITATKVFSLRHYTASAVATTGLGNQTNSGQVEVYAELEFLKIS